MDLIRHIFVMRVGASYISKMSDIPEPSFLPNYSPSEKNILGKEKEKRQKKLSPGRI